MTRLSVASKELQLQIVGPKNYAKAARVQRLNINKDVPTTTVDELGWGFSPSKISWIAGKPDGAISSHINMVQRLSLFLKKEH